MIGARLLSKIGRYLHERALYENAEPLLKRALAICEEQLGAAHLDIADRLNSLAELFRVQGRYGKAEPLYQRTLAIAEQQLGATHPDTATILNNLGMLYQAQDCYGEAEVFLKRAFAICEEQLGVPHPLTQQMRMYHLTLLSHIHTNGDLGVLLQSLSQAEQDDDLNWATTQK